MKLYTTALFAAIVASSCSKASPPAKDTVSPVPLVDAPPPIDATAHEPGHAVAQEANSRKEICSGPAVHAVHEGVPLVKLMRTVHTGSLPKAVAISPDGARIFVTNFGRAEDWNVFAYDPGKLERTGIVRFEGNGVEMAFGPGGKRLYVSNFREHEVIEIDPLSLSVVRSFGVGKNPKTLVVSPDGSRLYVSNWTSDSVTVIDLAKGEVAGEVRTDSQPRGIDVSPDGTRVYVACCAGETVDVIDTQKLVVTATVRLRAHGISRPRHLVVSPDGKRIYVTAMKSGLLYALDALTLAVVGKARTGAGPKTVDLTPDGAFAFTANFSSDSITAVNLSSFESRTYASPEMKAPCGLAVAHTSDMLYVTGWDASLLGEYAIDFGI